MVILKKQLSAVDGINVKISERQNPIYIKKIQKLDANFKERPSPSVWLRYGWTSKQCLA